MSEQIAEREVGRPVPARRTRRLVTGRTRWTDNISCPGMLHLAILRSPMAHARITRVDVSAGAGTPGRGRRVHRRRPRRRARRPAVRLAGDRGHGAPRPPRRWPPTRCATSARRSRWSSPATGTRPPTRSRRSRSTTSRCPRSSTWRRRSRTAPTWSTPTRAPTSRFTWPFDRRGYDAARAQAEAEGGVVVKRRYIQQRLIPTAMEPRAVVVGPTAARRVHRLLRHPDPARPAADARADHRHPRAQAARGRPRRRRRLRLASSTVRRGGHRARRWPASSAGRSSGPSRAARATRPTHHGRDQIQDIEIAADPRGHGCSGSRSTCIADMGAYLQLVTPGVPIAGRVHVQRDLQDGRVPVHVHRASSPTRRRPTPTAAPGGRRRRTPSSGSWTSSPSSSAWTRSSCAGGTGSSTRSSRTRRSPGSPTTRGNYEAATEKALELFGYDELRAEQSRAPGPRRPRAARHRRLHVHRDVRAGAVAGAGRAAVRRRRLGGGEHPDAADRQGRGGHRHHARTGRATRPRGARSPPTRSGVPFEDVEVHARRHPDLAAGHGHVRVAVAGRRRRRACTRPRRR